MGEFHPGAIDADMELVTDVIRDARKMAVMYELIDLALDTRDESAFHLLRDQYMQAAGG